MPCYQSAAAPSERAESCWCACLACSVPKLIDHDQRREQIVDAACALIAEDGLEGVTVRRVAAAAKLVPGSVRFIYPTHDALLAGTADGLVKHVRAQLKARAARYPRPDMAAARLTASLPLDASEVIRLWRVEKALRLSASRHAQFADALSSCRALRAEECRAVLAAVVGDQDPGDGMFGLELLRTLALVEGLGDLLVEGEVAPSMTDEAREVIRMHLREVRERWGAPQANAQLGSGVQQRTDQLVRAKRDLLRELERG